MLVHYAFYTKKSYDFQRTQFTDVIILSAMPTSNDVESYIEQKTSANIS